MTSLGDIKHAAEIENKLGESVEIESVMQRENRMVVATTITGVQVEIIKVDGELKMYWTDGAVWDVEDVKNPYTDQRWEMVEDIEMTDPDELL